MDDQSDKPKTLPLQLVNAKGINFEELVFVRGNYIPIFTHFITFISSTTGTRCS